jgi:hypothetical protein
MDQVEEEYGGARGPEPGSAGTLTRSDRQQSEGEARVSLASSTDGVAAGSVFRTFPRLTQMAQKASLWSGESGNPCASPPSATACGLSA